MGRIDSFRVAVMISQCGKYGASEVGLEHAVDGSLGIFDVQPGELRLRVVADQISGVNGPAQRILAGRSGERTYCLKSCQTKIVRRVTLVSSVRRCWKRNLALGQIRVGCVGSAERVSGSFGDHTIFLQLLTDSTCWTSNSPLLPHHTAGRDGNRTSEQPSPSFRLPSEHERSLA